MEWVAFPFSKGSSQPRDQTQVSRIAGRFFSSWATKGNPKNAKLGSLSHHPVDLPGLGIEPGSPALQADALLTYQGSLLGGQVGLIYQDTVS